MQIAQEQTAVSSERRPAYSLPLLLALALLTILAVVYLAWPIWRAFLPIEIDGNEGWNAYFADAVYTGSPLYGAQSLVFNNYPPLSFYVIGTIANRMFDALYVGRLASLLSIPATASAIWLCIRRLGGTQLASFTGAIWFCATMARFFDNYVGMDDPHLPALAIMALALAWLLGVRSGRERSGPPDRNDGAGRLL